MRNYEKSAVSETATRCESCDASVTCMLLKPCRNFAPALMSNFHASISIPNLKEDFVCELEM